MFGLADGNNFYVSCERVFNPALEGKPVVILSNNDGCVISRSNEAKALGVKMGEPFFLIRELVKRYSIRVFSSNYTLYGDMSHRMMETLKECVREVEIYSVDEAFLLFEDCSAADLNTCAGYVRERVKREVGIPMCIGIAPTKTLAKIANRRAKQEGPAGGVCVLDTPEKQRQAMKYVSIADVWGVGRQYAAKLLASGIQSAYDLSLVSEGWARKHLGGVVGVRLINELNGVSCLEMETLPSPKKNIACTRSFSTPVTALEHLAEAVSTYVIRAAEKLRQQDSLAEVITVFIHTSRFAQPEAHYSNSVTLCLPNASADTGELIHYALAGLRKIYQPDLQYKKAGVILSGLIPAQHVQLELFSADKRRKSQALMTVIDTINGKLGANTVSFAAAGTQKSWQTNREYLTRRYTTRWDELMQVKAG
jgi:DNA polymerase V